MQQINFQRPEKATTQGNGEILLIHSVFFTIQGEGPNVGKPAVFVRLGGCNLQCPGCDTDYTHGVANEHIESIVTRIGMAFGDYKGERLVVITGGEPFRQELERFINSLFRLGYVVQIETNGTLGFREPEELTFFARRFLQIVVSPKAGKVAESLYPWITAYKYVLDIVHIDPKDGLPTSALGMPAAPARPHAGFFGDVYVQPADEPKEEEFEDVGAINRANDDNLEACIQVAKKFGYRVCIQTHKILGVA